MATWGDISTWGAWDLWGGGSGGRLVHPTYKVIVSRMNNHDVAYTVVHKADGTFENIVDYKQDDPRWVDAIAVYQGGRECIVDSIEAAALRSAGYTVE